LTITSSRSRQSPGEQRISNPDEVKLYQQAFDLLYSADVGGRAVGVLIRAALAHLGEQPGTT
jgi:hypothetical protein